MEGKGVGKGPPGKILATGLVSLNASQRILSSYLQTFSSWTAAAAAAALTSTKRHMLLICGTSQSSRLLSNWKRRGSHGQRSKIRNLWISIFFTNYELENIVNFKNPNSFIRNVAYKFRFFIKSDLKRVENDQTKRQKLLWYWQPKNRKHRKTKYNIPIYNKHRPTKTQTIKPNNNQCIRLLQE